MSHPTDPGRAFETGEEATLAELETAGLLEAGPGCHISPHAVFVPVDHLGVARPVRIGARVRIGPFSLIHGGVHLADDVIVEHGAAIGKPEHGYAVGQVYAGAGTVTTIGPATVLRSGAVLYAGVEVGYESAVGHNTLLRSHVHVGNATLLGHNLTVERESWLGDSVRCSPGSHITSSTTLADRVFLGAGIRTVNDKTLTWRDPNAAPDLVPPRFDKGARVGSGSTVLGGVTVGEEALVGAGSVVTRDVDPHTIAYGVPAQMRGVR